jgi:uncharacterized protein YbjT (DUF2867 family)
MKNILIIGAGGKVGRKVANLLSGNGLPVVAMVRNKSKAETFFNPGVEVVEADLEEDFISTFSNCDCVVFSAGSGPDTSADKTLTIDLWAACKAIDNAIENKVNHFVMVSSRGADDPDTGPKAIKPYLIAKHFADKYLITSGLNYTILRPGRLLDEDGTGLITTIRPMDPEEQVISREDTARAIYYCLTNNEAIGRIYELYKGDEPFSSVFRSST